MRMMREILGLAVLVLSAPALAMEVGEVQGGCEPSPVRKLVKLESGKLERCGASGHVVVHVGPDGRLEQVSADYEAKACLTARMATWRLKMKEPRACTLELVSEAAASQFRASQMKLYGPHPPTTPPVMPPRPPQTPPPVPTQTPITPPLPPVAEVKAPPPLPPQATAKTDKVTERTGALQAKKAARLATLAARKAQAADNRAAAKAARTAKLQAAREKRQALAAQKAGKKASDKAKPAKKSKTNRRHPKGADTE